MNSNEPQTTIECGVAHPGFPCNHVFFPEDPDFGIWTRAVERAMEAIEDRSGEPVDFYPSEELVLGIVAETSEWLGYEVHPDHGDDMEHVESALIEALYE